MASWRHHQDEPHETKTDKQKNRKWTRGKPVGQKQNGEAETEKEMEVMEEEGEVEEEEGERKWER